MTVLRCDAGDEFGQLILPSDWAQNHTAVSVKGQCYRISLAKACLFGDGERNSHSQTVAPFRNRGFIRHGVYIEYTSNCPLTTAVEALGRIRPVAGIKWRFQPGRTMVQVKGAARPKRREKAAGLLLTKSS